ncbi:hypothetical protein K0T92_04840 [Paenibacillus oenotherae]|uniref:Uncharacterized protein n=1 Tax=Paenibacillus oenotherae TaxID=1435645 RepID=A0ABS7D2A4_9BACL|nr:hypothetical protein [Paenibacillus oenotherae]MBW7474059.1 hypothetical protein [Paenibacillus oenotherae]
MSLSKKELIRSIEEHLVNFQDRAIILLLSEGLTQEQILHLTIDSLDSANNRLQLAPAAEAITLDDYIMTIMLKASQEKEYYANNGHSEIKNRLEKTSRYIIRFAEGVRRDVFGIHFRIKNIAMRYELQEPYPWQ